MKKIFLIITVLSSIATAQKKAVIVDSITKEPVSYINIWVEGEDTGTTSDENGTFTLTGTDSAKRILLNALGYTSTYIKIADIKDTIKLLPQVIQLDEVIITNRKAGKKRFTINPLKRIKKVETIHSGGSARLIARHIPFKPEYGSTPYIHTLRFPVQKYKKHFMFNLRLYSVSDDGSPGEPMYSENILVNIPANKKEVSIDISHLNIKMPQEGCFIVAEKYLLKQNISATVYEKVIDENYKLIPEKDRKYLYDLFGPVFICEQTATDEGGWNYYNGKWTKGYHIQVVSPPEKTHLRGLLAVEVTLTD